MNNFSTLLESVRQRPRRAGKGLGLAVDYVGGLVSCFGDQGCSTRMAKLLAGDWQKALKDAEQKLVYRNAGMKVRKESLTTATGSITPGFLLEFECISTNNQKDRDGDVLEPSGAKVDPAGPLLWQHITFQPIGKLLRVVGNDGANLIERCGIIDLKNPLTDDAALLVQAGVLRISIGFDPEEFEPIKGPAGGGGWWVKVYEILERSLVSIPANAGAAITLVSRGKLHSPLIKGWAEQLYRNRPSQVVGGWTSKSVVGFPDVRQTGDSNCGCASLRGVAKLHGVGPEGEKDFAQLLGTTDKNGTDFTELVKVGKDLGLQVQELHGDADGKVLDSWLEKGWPVICAIQRGGTPESRAGNKEGHYVTCLESNAEKVLYQDPVDGRNTKARADFIDDWHDQDAGGKLYTASGIAFGPPVKASSGKTPRRGKKKHGCTCGAKSRDDLYGGDDEDLECPYCGSDEVDCDSDDPDSDCRCDNCGESFDREEAMDPDKGKGKPVAENKTPTPPAAPPAPAAPTPAKALAPALAKKYGPFIGLPFFAGSYEQLTDDLEDAIRDKFGKALDIEDRDQVCVIATFPDRAVFVAVEGYSYGYSRWDTLGDGDWDEDDGYRYYQHPWAMQDGKPTWADGEPAEVELTAAAAETAKGIAAMKTKSGRAVSEKTMAALKDCHGLFDSTKALSDLIADHKGKCDDGMKCVKDVMEGDDGGDSEPAGDAQEGDYATTGEGGKGAKLAPPYRVVTIKRLPVYDEKGTPLGVKETITVLKEGKVLSKARAEKCIKAHGIADELGDHDKMPRAGKSMMRECKSILKEVVTGAGYDVAGKDESNDPSGKPNPGADGEANPMDGDGKALDALCCKAIGALLAGKAPSPGVLASLKEAVDDSSQRLPEMLLAG